MSVINHELLNRINVKVKLKNPKEVRVKIVKPGSNNNFIKTVLYGGLFIKYKGSFIPVFYLDKSASIVIPTTRRDIVISGGLENVNSYPLQLIHLAMESISDVNISINGASYYELYRVKQFLDLVTPYGSNIREKYMVELYNKFREIQSVMAIEKVDDVVVFYLTDGSSVAQISDKNVRMLDTYTDLFKRLGYNEKLEHIEIIRKILLLSEGNRAIIDERDGMPLISVDGVKWIDISSESDYVVAIYNDSHILANIENTVLLHSKRDSEFEYLIHRAKYLYTIKVKNVKKVYKVNSMFLVNVSGKLKYNILKEVTDKLDELDLLRTQLYSMHEKINQMKRVASVKVLNLISALFEDEF